MIEAKGERIFDLEERTFRYAKSVRELIAKLKFNESNLEDKKQLIRSSGSVAANYIEANEALSQKDFLFRIKICKKEAKESFLWLRLLGCGVDEVRHAELNMLVNESLELAKIFGSIANRYHNR